MIDVDAIAKFLVRATAKGAAQVALVRAADKEQVDAWELPAKDGEDLPQIIRETLDAYIVGLKGTVRFELQATKADAPDVVARHSIHVQCANKAGDLDADASVQNILIALVRDRQTESQRVSGMIDTLLAKYHDFMDLMAKRLVAYEGYHLRLVQQAEEIESRKVERDTMMLKAKHEVEHTKEALDALKPAIKLMMGKLAMGGREIQFPEGGILADDLIESALGSLTEQQFTAMMGILKPEQGVAFIEAYQAYQKRAEEKKTAAAQKEAQAAVNGAAGVG